MVTLVFLPEHCPVMRRWGTLEARRGGLGADTQDDVVAHVDYSVFGTGS